MITFLGNNVWLNANNGAAKAESRYTDNLYVYIYICMIYKYIYYIIYNMLDLGVFNLECSTDRILYNWMIWIVASIFCPIRPEIILLHYM